MAGALAPQAPRRPAPGRAGRRIGRRADHALPDDRPAGRGRPGRAPGRRGGPPRLANPPHRPLRPDRRGASRHRATIPRRRSCRRVGSRAGARPADPGSGALEPRPRRRSPAESLMKEGAIKAAEAKPAETPEAVETVEVAAPRKKRLRVVLM